MVKSRKLFVCVLRWALLGGAWFVGWGGKKSMRTSRGSGQSRQESCGFCTHRFPLRRVQMAQAEDVWSHAGVGP